MPLGFVGFISPSLESESASKRESNLARDLFRTTGLQTEISISSLVLTVCFVSVVVQTICASPNDSNTLHEAEALSVLANLVLRGWPEDLDESTFIDVIDLDLESGRSGVLKGHKPRLSERACNTFPCDDLDDEDFLVESCCSDFT